MCATSGLFARQRRSPNECGPGVHPPETLPIVVRPLQPTIGAEIEGVELRQPLRTSARDAIKSAVLRYKVVVFRDQLITRQQQSVFARQFGPLYDHPTTVARTRSFCRRFTTSFRSTG
jgi:alpha-ketoglutarate-dependent taurine dioxygenase